MIVQHPIYTSTVHTYTSTLHNQLIIHHPPNNHPQFSLHSHVITGPRILALISQPLSRLRRSMVLTRKRRRGLKAIISTQGNQTTSMSKIILGRRQIHRLSGRSVGNSVGMGMIRIVSMTMCVVGMVRIVRGVRIVGRGNVGVAEPHPAVNHGLVGHLYRGWNSRVCAAGWVRVWRGTTACACGAYGVEGLVAVGGGVLLGGG